MSTVLCSLLFTLAITGPSHAGTINVLVTSKPAHALVALVMGDMGQPGVLIDGNASPHTYAMRPSDARKLASADVFVRISPSLEPFSEKLVQAAGSRVNIITLAEAPGLTLHEKRTSPTFKNDLDHTDHHSAHSHGHAHSAGTRFDKSDPHFWLDPANAKVLLSYIAVKLGRKMPDLASALKQNAAQAGAGIDKLDTELRERLTPIAGQPFIVFHDAVQYIEKRYGLNAVGAIKISPETSPGARRLSKLRSKIKTLGAICVFSEPQFSPRLVTAITTGTDVRTGTLDPEGTSLTAGPQFYAAMMDKIANDLLACLAPDRT